MDVATPRSPKERPLFILALVISVFVWLLVAVSIVGLIYALLGALFALIIRALILAGIKGNGVRISAEQLPELHARVATASTKLGLQVAPEAYLLNDRGIFNAFAARFLGRNFIVLYTELLENCDDQSGAADFIIGHEIAHHALGHLKYQTLLLPARIVPLLGPAYSRACEYSCDSAGLAVVERQEAAVAGLAVLAAGGKYAKKLNIDAYLKQRLDTGRFWQAVLELNMSHPFLSKRIGALVQKQNAASVPHVGRNPFSYIAAPFFAFASGGSGAASGILVVVAVLGIMAAIAIPNFLKFQERRRGQGAGIFAPQQGEMGAEENSAQALEMLRKAQEELARQQGTNEGVVPANDAPAQDAAAEPPPPPKGKAHRPKGAKRPRH